MSQFIDSTLAPHAEPGTRHDRMPLPVTTDEPLLSPELRQNLDQLDADERAAQVSRRQEELARERDLARFD